MVLAFAIGLFVGLPVGCYLREVGYVRKFHKAYEVFSPDDGSRKTDNYQNKSKEFYENLARGQVDHKDFERYIYGGSYNQKITDDRDKQEKSGHEALRREMNK
jgi:hypothetical protein